MPWLLGRQPGPSLVQVSLNSSEFSEPHERCIFNLYVDHRSREMDFFPSIAGPQDINTSRLAHRKLHELNAARHRPLAHNDASARNNELAQLRYLSAIEQPYEARPSIRSILRAAVAEVDDKGFLDMYEVVSLARFQEAPLDIKLRSFDTHPVLNMVYTPASLLSTQDILNNQFNKRCDSLHSHRLAHKAVRTMYQKIHNSPLVCPWLKSSTSSSAIKVLGTHYWKY